MFYDLHDINVAVTEDMGPRHPPLLGPELFSQSHSCTQHQELVHYFQLPTVDSQQPHGTRESDTVKANCSAFDLSTWLGGLACGVDTSGETPDDYVSTFQTPEPHRPYKYGTRVRWTGMVHTDWVCGLLQRAR